jgi:single-strand DNA-binding protein
MINHVLLVGNIGRDPEVTAVNDQDKVTRLSVATHETVTKRTGERERKTEWHEVVAWGTLGEAVKGFHTGCSVLVQGRLQTRVWADFRGTKHITAEVRADRILLLSVGSREGEAARKGRSGAKGERLQAGASANEEQAAVAPAESAS